MMKIDFHLFNLPLKHPFTISRYTVTIQKTMVVRISDGDVHGYGEATVNPYYHSTVEKLSASVVKVKPLVETIAPIHPTQFWELIAPHLKNDYFALCAIDYAYWDYFARKAKRPLKNYFMGRETPLTS